MNNIYIEKLRNIYNPKIYIPKNYINDDISFDLCFLIPVYNSEATLFKCLNSVCKQNTKYNYSIIIVNDGSTDKSEDIIKKFEKNNTNIYYYFQNNQGISCARNFLLSKSNGKFISFLDSDDYISDNFVENTLNIAYKNKLEYVKSNYVKKAINGKVIYKTNYKENDKIYDMDRYLWGAIIKKELFRNVSFPEKYWFEDMIYSFLVLSKVEKYTISSETTYFYIDFPKSASKIQGKKENIKNLEQFFLIYYMIDFCQKNNIKLNKFQQIIIYNELEIMLMIRTRSLERKIRKITFLAACELINNSNICLEYKSAKIFKYKLFTLWNINAIFKRLKQKLR